MLTLYYCKKSCAYAPHILLHDAEADFEVRLAPYRPKSIKKSKN